VYHSNNKIVEVISSENRKMDFDGKDTIALGLHKLAAAFPDQKIVWCHSLLRQSLNVEIINTLFHHKKMMLSYGPTSNAFFDGTIGYVDESPFVRINKTVTFPSWQMSSAVGGVHAEVLLALDNAIPFEKNFDYFLCSVAKLSMPLGLFCYSEPRLLKQKEGTALPKATSYTLFRFVKQHYKMRWIFLLLLDTMLYERKFPLAPFLVALFYKNRKISNTTLKKIRVQSSRRETHQRAVDVIIPTIGRKAYLYEVLLDLKSQNHLPEKVIIVEQNPEEGSESELDYISNEQWPFLIKHIFTHRPGACNARNLALEQVSGEWVFFADDDIRIGADFIQKAMAETAVFGVEAVSVSCLQKGQKQIFRNVFQWGTFGSGCSLVFAESLKGCEFNRSYEFGFGEDADFGMQLRNKGCDILFLPEPEILHLKAPVGGFRTKPLLQWHKDPIQPKPSPTVMLNQILHHTPEQIRGYKTTLFFKFYQHQKIGNPLSYLINFRQQWNQSVLWANELKKQNEI
jgi:hypothetical protein